MLEITSLQGLIEWHALTLAGSQVNIKSMYNLYASQPSGQFWPQELIELNDCLYRNLYRHEYLAMIDVDEMILPRTGDWRRLIRHYQVRDH